LIAELKSSGVIDSLELTLENPGHETFPKSYQINFGNKTINFTRIEKGSEYPIGSSYVYTVDANKKVKPFTFEGTNEVILAV